MEEALGKFTGTQPRASTVHGTMLFLDFVIGVSKSRKEFFASRDIAEPFVSRIKSKGGESIRLLPFLCEIGLIKKVGKHSQEAALACRYRFLLKPQKQKVRIHPSTHSLKRVEAAKQRNGLTNDPLASWVRESMDRVTVPDEVLNELLQRKDKDYSGIVNLMGSKSYFVKKKKTRITTSISNLPKEAREQILLDGKPVSRLDINGSHLHMLGAEIERRAKYFGGNREAKLREELAIWRTVLSKGDDAYLELFPEFPKARRSKIKDDFRTFLNAPMGKQNPATAKAMRNRFPAITTVVTGQNKNGKSLGPFLQIFENQIIRKTILALNDLGIYSVPVVDEIIVPWFVRDKAIETMSHAIFETCGTKALISGIRYQH